DSAQSGGDIAAAGFVVPAVASMASSTAAKHVVKAGETLSGIARRYRLSVAELSAQNGIRNGKIRAGQLLSVGAPVRGGAGADRPRTAKGTPARRTTGNARPATRKDAANPAPRIVDAAND